MLKEIKKDQYTEGMDQCGNGRERIKSPPEGMIRLYGKHSERMYRQNRNKYRGVEVSGSRKILYMDTNSFICELQSVSIPEFWEIGVRTIAVDKFTVVELTYNGKHYHGLSARAECDEPNEMTGIYHAYHRAFKSMLGL